EIQFRVPRDERVEGPVHRLDTHRPAALALVLLQRAPDLAPLHAVAHGEHVGPVHEVPILHAGDAEHEPAQRTVRHECARADSPEFLADEQDRRGNALGERGAPGRLLQAHGAHALVMCRELADDDSTGEGYVLHAGRGRSTSGPTIPPGVCVMRKLATIVAVLVAGSVGACRSAISTGAAPSGGPYDVVITNGRIVDGTGNAWFWGDVGIRGDRIARIAPRGLLSAAPAAKRIDAHGLD